MLKSIKLFILITLPFGLFGQQTTGLFEYDWHAEEGFILWGPIFSRSQYLMNNCGEIVHTWEDDTVSLGNSIYLLENGTLLRCAKADTAISCPIGAGGGSERIQKVDWDGNVTWDFIYYDMQKRLHHDIELLPNGNILAIAWVRKDMPTCIQAGRNPGTLSYGELYNERIIEIEPTGPHTGNVVWQWDLWDHLVQDFDNTKDNFGVIADHPELLNVNWLNENEAVPGQSDFIHLNAIDYNAELDQIVLSSQILSEIWIIDHSTTTQEAASHAGGTYGKGGDFLYRYGNPQVYNRGDATDQKLWRQHDAHWIESGLADEGGIMIFNNGLDRPVSFSEIDVVMPPQTSPGVYELAAGESYGPTETVWNYHASDSVSFYSYFISGAGRLPNGNTLICEGNKGKLFEVTYDGQKVWEYVNPVTVNGIISSTDPIPMAGGGAFQGNIVFRAEKYAVDFPGFAGHDLSTGIQLEANPIISNCFVGLEDFDASKEFSIYPNPTTDQLTLENMNGANISIYNVSGQLVMTERVTSEQFQFELLDKTAGIYAVRIELNGKTIVKKLMVQ
ncbi:MAG: aryl-sulfate sulfotransferase [Flavobacteriales bacterium]|nr:aryl-sulfate sulfotransferase [Flavobacteriales bacterium]